MAKGIDYGMGRANIDTATGIRYGVISQHSVSGDALEDIYSNGTNLSYEASKEDARKRIADALSPILDDILDDLGVLPYVSKYSPSERDQKRYQDAIDSAVDSVWESIEQDFNDQYQEDGDTYRYESNGYVLETSSLGLFVIKSPFYTYASFCSPCAPGAGDLDTPADDSNSGVKTYCLGYDWFDTDRPCQYVVISVDGDEVVKAEDTDTIGGN